jgi:septum formation protein
MIYLASTSPRRRELLMQIGVSYHCLQVDIDESLVAGESAEDYVRRLAKAKAEAGACCQAVLKNPHPVLAADTAVVVDERILGKPRDQQHGLAMLASLSGRCHQVLTAVALAKQQQVLVRLSRTEVCFRPLSSEECLDYWQAGESDDKAGAYGIQGVAARFISHICGSYSGVVGLPLYETAELLQDAGIEFARRHDV